MTEQFSHPEAKKRISRRDFLARGVGIALSAAAMHALSEGIALKRPLLEVRPRYIHRGVDEAQPLSGDMSAEANDEKIITLTPNGELLFEPYGAFFIDDREFHYAHRGGNSFEAIDEAYSLGADMFDIDANDVKGVDTVYGEHGIIPNAGKWGVGLHVPIVLDVDEKELKLGMPSSYEKLVAYIASLSTDERPLAVSTELKRGAFDEDTIRALFAIHENYQVPVVFHSPDPQKLIIIGSQLAASYSVAA